MKKMTKIPNKQFRILEKYLRNRNRNIELKKETDELKEDTI